MSGEEGALKGGCECVAMRRKMMDWCRKWQEMYEKGCLWESGGTSVKECVGVGVWVEVNGE